MMSHVDSGVALLLLDIAAAKRHLQEVQTAVRQHADAQQQRSAAQASGPQVARGGDAEAVVDQLCALHEENLLLRKRLKDEQQARYKLQESFDALSGVVRSIHPHAAAPTKAPEPSQGLSSWPVRPSSNSTSTSPTPPTLSSSAHCDALHPGPQPHQLQSAYFGSTCSSPSAHPVETSPVSWSQLSPRHRLPPHPATQLSAWLTSPTEQRPAAHTSSSQQQPRSRPALAASPFSPQPPSSSQQKVGTSSNVPWKQQQVSPRVRQALYQAGQLRLPQLDQQLPSHAGSTAGAPKQQLATPGLQHGAGGGVPAATAAISGFFGDGARRRLGGGSGSGAGAIAGNRHLLDSPTASSDSSSSIDHLLPATSELQHFNSSWKAPTITTSSSLLRQNGGPGAAAINLLSQLDGQDDAHTTSRDGIGSSARSCSGQDRDTGGVCPAGWSHAGAWKPDGASAVRPGSPLGSLLMQYSPQQPLQQQHSSPGSQEASGNPGQQPDLQGSSQPTEASASRLQGPRAEAVVSLHQMEQLQAELAARMNHIRQQLSSICGGMEAELASRESGQAQQHAAQGHPAAATIAATAAASQQEVDAAGASSKSSTAPPCQPSSTSMAASAAVMPDPASPEQEQQQQQQQRQDAGMLMGIADLQAMLQAHLLRDMHASSSRANTASSSTSDAYDSACSSGEEGSLEDCAWADLLHAAAATHEEEQALQAELIRQQYQAALSRAAAAVDGGWAAAALSARLGLGAASTSSHAGRGAGEAGGDSSSARQQRNSNDSSSAEAGVAAQPASSSPGWLHAPTRLPM